MKSQDTLPSHYLRVCLAEWGWGSAGPVFAMIMVTCIKHTRRYRRQSMTLSLYETSTYSCQPSTISHRRHLVSSGRVSLIHQCRRAYELTFAIADGTYHNMTNLNPRLPHECSSGALSKTSALSSQTVDETSKGLDSKTVGQDRREAERLDCQILDCWP